MLFRSTLYDYSTDSLGYRTTTTIRGIPVDATVIDPVIRAGSKEVRKVSPSGYLDRVETWDLSDDGNAQTVERLVDRRVYEDVDEFKRPRPVRFFDNTFEQTTYGCCGVESVTSRDGAVTTYFYDALGRQESSMIYGVRTRKIGRAHV